MAISRKTQKDVGRYQAKLGGPLTLRQTIDIGIGAILDALVWNILGAAGSDMATKITIAIIIIIPFGLLGTANPFGMTCSEFIKNYYEYHLLSSKTRIYETITDDELIKTEAELKNDEQTAQESKGKKKANKNKKANTSDQVQHKRDKNFPDYQ